MYSFQIFETGITYLILNFKSTGNTFLYRNNNRIYRLTVHNYTHFKYNNIVVNGNLFYTSISAEASSDQVIISFVSTHTLKSYRPIYVDGFKHV